MNDLETISDELVESWVNGNHSHVYSAITNNSTNEAIALTALICHKLPSGQAERFVNYLKAKVEG